MAMMLFNFCTTYETLNQIIWKLSKYLLATTAWRWATSKFVSVSRWQLL